jgi:hypothetical protein
MMEKKDWSNAENNPCWFVVDLKDEALRTI